MNKEKLNKHVPTLMGYLERRRKKAENQLPKHLRPRPIYPIFIQIALNVGIVYTLCWLMLNRDEFMSEATPALGLVICLLLTIYTLISAFQIKRRFPKPPGRRWAKINLWLMGAAGFLVPVSVAFFLP